MKNFDIDTVAACEAGAEIELLHPATNAPTGIFIKVIGKDSKAWRKIVNAAADAERFRQHQAEKRGKKADPKPQEQIEADASDMLSQATLGWRYETIEGEGAERKVINHANVVPFGGTELPFTQANALKFYNERPSYKAQIDEGIANLENFIKS